MRHQRANIRLSDFDLKILAEAAVMWPSDAGNRSELIRRVMWEWWVLRAEGGGKTSRILERIAQAERRIIEEVRGNV